MRWTREDIKKKMRVAYEGVYSISTQYTFFWLIKNTLNYGQCCHEMCSAVTVINYFMRESCLAKVVQANLTQFKKP